MFTKNWVSEKQFRLISLLLFCSLFLYIILRAWFVDILHDEAATFLHYIETGHFWGPKSITDANNHLLNSVVCHGIYKVFGEQFFLMRLPNILSFPIYFWSLFQLVSIHKNYLFRLFVLLGTTCIPFILEYFANCRGYGISLAFFTASLVFLYRLSQNISIRLHLLLSLCLLIASYANLTFLVSAVLAAVYVLIQQVLQKNELNLKRQVFHLVIHFCFALLIIPAALYARILKEGGALYYGSLDGLWEVTGFTLAKYTLFTNVSFTKWILLACGLVLIAFLIQEWIKVGVKKFFSRRDAVLAWFFFGHLFVILVLAHFMEVNYPEDRVGMYLIILTLLLAAGLIEKISSVHFLFVGFLFFPFSMISKMNLDTSIFSPDDRMTKTFYDKVYSQLELEKTSMAMYHLMNLTWPMHNRYSQKHVFPAISGAANQASDLILSRVNLELPAKDLTEYDTLFLDPSNGFIAFKRTTPFIKTSVFDTLISQPPSNAEFCGIYSMKIPDSLKNCKIQLHVSGEVSTDKLEDELVLSYSIFNTQNQSTYHDMWTSRWYNGLNSVHSFTLNYPIEKWDNDDDELRLYFYNPQKNKVNLKSTRFEILKLE